MCLDFQCIDDRTLDKLIGETNVTLRHRIDEHPAFWYPSAGTRPQSSFLSLRPIGTVLMQCSDLPLVGKKTLQISMFAHKISPRQDKNGLPEKSNQYEKRKLS